MSNKYSPSSAAACVKSQGSSTQPHRAGSTAPKLAGNKGMRGGAAGGASQLKSQYGSTKPSTATST